jgi:hypothetical protein
VAAQFRADYSWFHAGPLGRWSVARSGIRMARGRIERTRRARRAAQAAGPLRIPEPLRNEPLQQRGTRTRL